MTKLLAIAVPVACRVAATKASSGRPSGSISQTTPYLLGEVNS